MNKNQKNFLRIGKLEGYSFLLLLGVAMPLKYFLNYPLAVRMVGMVHGILFVWFMYTILILLSDKEIKFKQALIAFVLSLIPFGTFYLEKLVLNSGQEK